MRKTAWVYSGSSRYIELLKMYSSGFRDFFTRFARVSFTKGTVDVSQKGVSNAWRGMGNVHPMISAARPEGKRMRKVGNPELADIINTLKERGICEYNGIHTNIEPYHPGQLRFFDLLKERTGKKISASLPSNWDKRIIKSVDMAVLMAYDYHTNPREYLECFKRRVERFGEACEELRTEWMIGIPVVATHTEYRIVWSEHMTTMARIGHEMEEYFLPAYNFLKELSKNSSYLKGVAIWGFLSGPLKTKEGLTLGPWEMDSDSLESLD